VVGLVSKLAHLSHRYISLKSNDKRDKEKTANAKSPGAVVGLAVGLSS